MGPTQGGQTEKVAATVLQEAPLAAERGRGRGQFWVSGARWLMCTGPWRALDRPRAPCAGEAGPCRLSQTQAGSELPLAGSADGPGAPRGALQPRCFPAAALVASFAAPGGFPGCCGGAAGPGLGGWAPAGAWRQGGTAPRKQLERGLARAPPFPSSCCRSPSFPPASALLSPAPGQASAGELSRTTLGAGRHTCPAPSSPLSQPVPPTLHVQPCPATHPTHATASTSPHTDERIENKEPVDQPPSCDAEEGPA